MLLAVAALVLSAFGAPSFADLTTASPAPPYLQGTGERFYAAANKSWSPARELTADASNNPLNKPQGEWDPDTVVWAKKCSSKAQTVSFQRELTLPGRPTTSSFSIAPVYPFGVASAFKSFRLQLNGATVAKGPLTGSPYSGPTITLAAPALKRFRDGKNVAVVTVVRGALPSTQKKCNTSAADLTGVLFRFSGDFDADLSLVDPSIPTTKYYRAGPEVRAIVNLSLTNNGPAGVVKGGIFTAKVTGISDLLMLGDSPTHIPGTYPTAPPFDDCEATTLTPKPNLTVQIRCELGAMKAGDVGYLSLGLAQTFPSTAFAETATVVTWQVSHPMDSTYDNLRGAQLVWCGTLSTKPECLGLS